ncbi:hypothetical protein EB234_30760 [Mesorhizobium japonicum R7A]|uniref:Uncharacterized protein n=1 Tax=Mesorhizobium loti R88b TaxID=935548 RepID=A0A6M7X1C0_RHILI|nr:hypothetical protein EB234_30760 [Mesorhizobium japonicum R7A]QKD05808.1 hypothetical protein EB235_33830 [Mesorhizobium loti R88b]
MAVEAVWTSKEIILAIIATGLISALAGWVADFVKERWSEKRSARYAAMRCAIAFESYAADCWNNANMSEGHFHMAEEAYSESLPPAPVIPEDIDWRSVDPILADAVLSFMTSSKIAESEAAYARVYEGNPFDFDDATRMLGRRALEISSKLRSRYGMRPSAEYEKMHKRLKGSG